MSCIVPSANFSSGIQQFSASLCKADFANHITEVMSVISIDHTHIRTHTQSVIGLLIFTSPALPHVCGANNEWNLVAKMLTGGCGLATCVSVLKYTLPA